MSKTAEELVGERIKKLRKEQNFTLRTLSENCGLSANAISQIERGENSATISSLTKIANALHISINDLFYKSHDQNIFYLKNGRGLGKNTNNFFIQSLGFGLHEKQLEPYHITLFPKMDMTEEAMSHPGQEFVYCLAGEVEFIINDQKYTLEKGDSLLFNSTLLHECRNAQSQNAELLLITQSLVDPNIAAQQHFTELENKLSLT